MKVLNFDLVNFSKAKPSGPGTSPIGISAKIKLLLVDRCKSFALIFSFLAISMTSTTHAQAGTRHLLSLRASETYKRAYQICSNPFEFSKFEYSRYAAEHGITLFMAVADTLFLREQKRDEPLFESGLLVSPQLARDLSDEAFYLAMSDCGISIEDTKWIVMSLISADIVGKAAVVIGATGFSRVLLRISRTLQGRWVKVGYWALGIGAAGSGLGILYSIFTGEDLVIEELDSSDFDPEEWGIEECQDQECIEFQEFLMLR